MRNLILVKHSHPEIIPDIPAAEWQLSAAGRRGSLALAERLAIYQPSAIVASREPKANETAQIVAQRLGLHHMTAEGLHEHDRSNVGWSSAADFALAVEHFFAHPSALVFGRETAYQVGERFTRAADQAITTHPTGDLVIVAHGTVIALFVAARASVEPLPLWRRLGLPSFVVLSLPDLVLVEIVEQIV
jgi:broad specificity phosphatase PhoE